MAKKAAAKPKTKESSNDLKSLSTTLKTSIPVAPGVDVDAAIMSLDLEVLEDKHNLAKNGYKPTAEFLNSVSKMLKDKYKVDATPTLALMVWSEVGNILATVKNVIGSRAS